jgi:hypothetical protein
VSPADAIALPFIERDFETPNPARNQVHEANQLDVIRNEHGETRISDFWLSGRMAGELFIVSICKR